MADLEVLDADYVVDPDGRIVHWSEEAEALLGYGSQEILGENHLTLVPPSDRDEARRYLLKMRNGEPVRCQPTALQSKDGHPIEVSLSIRPICGANGTVVGGAVLARNHCERARAQSKLRESEGRFREVFESAPFGICTTGLDGRFLQVNEALCRILGYSREELLGTTWMALIHPDDLQPTLQRLERLHTERVGFLEAERRYLHRGGRVILGRVRASLVRGCDGQPLYYVTHAEDITEKRLAEDALRESESRFRIMADGCPEMMWVTDAEGSIRFVNRECRRFFGVDLEGLAGSSWQLVLHPDDAPEYCGVVQQAVRDQAPFRAEARVRRADGEWRWINTSAEPRFAPNGQFLGHVGISPDITERKQVEQALQRSEEEFRQFAENVRSVIWITSPGAEEVLYVNHAYQEIWGRSCESLYRNPSSWMEAIHGEDRQRARTVLARLTEGESVETEYRIRTPEGREKWIRDRAFPVRDGAGQLIRTTGISEDITERKRFQEELIQARQDAEAANRTKGEFLANMSHEIRTPLNGILGLADLVLGDDLNPVSRKRIHVLRESAKGLLALVNDILDLSKLEARKMRLEAEDFDLRAVVEGVADLMAVKAQEKGLELLCLIEPDVPTRLRGDANRVRQILLNLAGNAVKFTKAGEVSIRVRLEPSSGNAVRFEVRDTGVGIPEDKQRQLFRPFAQADASTARHYGGTGLGLSIVRHLAELMGGCVGLESVQGKGSCFWFVAPLPSQAGVKRPPGLSLAGRRVLVVDDNAASRAVLLELLALWRCEAEAVEPEAALARLESAGPFDAVVIDLEMPSLPGDRLAAVIQANPRCRRTPLLVMTPLGRPGSPEHWEQAGFSGRVSKPVKQGEFGTCLASVMGYGLPPRPEAMSAAGDERIPPESRSRFRLLLVEDNPVNQEVAVGILQRLGYRVHVVDSGAGALDALEESDFDLVLMDCQMAEMDGYEATRSIRQPGSRVRNPAVPVVALTAHAMAGDREKCLAAGMNDYLTKPVEPRALDRTLECWLTGRSQGDGAPVPRQVQQIPSEQTVFDREGLLDRVMGDEQTAQRVVTAFLSSVPGQMAALGRAVIDADAAGARLAAHSIKGAAANAGGQKLFEAAWKAEKMGAAADLDSVAALLPELQMQLARLRPEMKRFCHQAEDEAAGPVA